jgi:hypothetical protein
MSSAAAKAAMEVGMEIEPSGPTSTRVTGSSRTFDKVNALPPVDVATWLGIMDGEQPRCPGCRETDQGVAFVRGGLKCSHNRCAGKGKKPGFRTNVDLTMEVRGIGKYEAVAALCERFGIEDPNRKGADAVSVFGAGANEDGEGDIAEPGDIKSGGAEPTADDPLHGLEHLAAVALLGRDRILALAKKLIEYVWKDIAPPGTVTLIAGPPADGKTTLLFLILAARANLEAPISLLGREVRPAPPEQYLVLIEGEHSEASTSRKLVKSLGLLGVDDKALDRVIIVARKAVKLGSPEWLDVVRMIAAGLVSDVAVDTVARIALARADSEEEQVAIFEGIAQAIESAPEGVKPPNVWAVAHTRKNNATGELADVSGSVQRVGQSDSVLLVKAEREDGRVVSTRVVFAKLREDPDEWPEASELTISKDANGVQSLNMGCSAKSPDDDRPLEERIVALLALKSMTKNALSKKLRRNKNDLEPAFSALFAARRIETTNVTIKGQEYTGFQLRKSTPYSTPYSVNAERTAYSTPDGEESP